jgi:Fur family iron response transcriptional regulator
MVSTPKVKNRGEPAGGVAATLRQHGIKPTPQRLAIAAVILAKHQHLSAEQVLARVNTTHRLLSKATVYNTLRLFGERGLVREVVVDPARVYFDSNTVAHHHLYDARTGEITDISPEHLAVTGSPPLPQGMEVAAIEVVVRTRRQS